MVFGSVQIAYNGPCATAGGESKLIRLDKEPKAQERKERKKKKLLRPACF